MRCIIFQDPLLLYPWVERGRWSNQTSQSCPWSHLEKDWSVLANFKTISFWARSSGCSDPAPRPRPPVTSLNYSCYQKQDRITNLPLRSKNNQSSIFIAGNQPLSHESFNICCPELDEEQPMILAISLTDGDVFRRFQALNQLQNHLLSRVYLGLIEAPSQFQSSLELTRPALMKALSRVCRV